MKGLDKILTDLLVQTQKRDEFDNPDTIKIDYPQIDKAVSKLQTVIDSAVIDAVQKIKDAGYDDMHKTYDYKRISEAVFDKLAQLNNSRKEEL